MCHTTTNWAVHYSGHDFPLNHGGAGSECTTCHTSSFDDYTCFQCHEHDPAETADKHAEEGITDLSDCAGCHPDGKD
jgi:hypothetical protein